MHKTPHTNERHLSKPVVLVIDDNEPFRNLVRLALGAVWDVVEARDGQAGLDLARAHDPDVVLQDLLLPDLSGFDLLAELRALPGWQDRPILAISGWTAKMHEARRQGLPFTDYLLKPFSIADLCRMVDTYRRVGSAA
jgi:DNA-binding response OmpR family regulator